MLMIKGLTKRQAVAEVEAVLNYKLPDYITNAIQEVTFGSRD